MHTRLPGLVALMTLLTLPASARDHLLTFGGGSSVSNNQVSLEKNVLYLQRFLGDAGLTGVPHEILFADGTGGARDLEFDDPNVKLPRATELLADVFDQEAGLTTQYRAHAIPHLWGPSTRASLNRWFDTVGSRLRDGDRLIIYYTGHGGRGRGRDGKNQTLALWGEPDLTVRDFDAMLERLPPKVSVVLIMVQCFGGGFADVIYDGADPARGLTRRNRCGFFATVPTRVAAGCTSDVNEENYREYSTYFFAALYGRTRTGEKVEPKPDYDGDGQVSLAEAHAYALIHSDTIDLSMKTSDALLRQFSSMRPRTTAELPQELLTENSDYDQLLAAASPVDRAVLDGLSDRLQLDGPRRAQQARGISMGIEQRRQSLEQKRQRLQQAHNQLRRSLQRRVKGRWPELGNLLNPSAARLLAEQGDAIVKYLEASPRFPEFETQSEEMAAIGKESDEAERKWVKAQRFLRQCESVALEANLSKVASGPVLQKQLELLTAEGGTFVTAEKP
jgi:hypothetical protein